MARLALLLALLAGFAAVALVAYDIGRESAITIVVTQDATGSRELRDETGTGTLVVDAFCSAHL